MALWWRRFGRPWHVWEGGRSKARERAFLIAYGSVRLYRVTPDGHEVTMTFKHDGALFDFQRGDGGDGPKDDAEALFDGTIIYDISHEWLGRFARAHPVVLYKISLMLREMVRESRDIAVDRSRVVEIRVAHALPRIAGPRDTVELTRCCLATVVQASREEVGRALKRLRAAGLVAYRDNERAIRLLDKGALTAWEENALL